MLQTNYSSIHPSTPGGSPGFRLEGKMGIHKKKERKKLRVGFCRSPKAPFVGNWGGKHHTEPNGSHCPTLISHCTAAIFNTEEKIHNNN